MTAVSIPTVFDRATPKYGVLHERTVLKADTNDVRKDVAKALHERFFNVLVDAVGIYW